MNDPVGIALMASLIAAGGVGVGAFVSVGESFVLEMFVGGAVWVIGGRGLLWFMRRVSLPSEGLYPLRTLASVMVLFGVATLAHGSGFLAVFVAGIVLADAQAPYKREIERFHAALASLGEIVAFIVLGLTIDLQMLARADVWIPGIVLGAVLALVIRPAGGGVSAAGGLEPQRASLRSVCRTQGRRADPSRYLHPGRARPERANGSTASSSSSCSPSSCRAPWSQPSCGACGC